MMNPYDILTGFQVVMIIILSAYTCYFQKQRQCMPFIIIVPCLLFSVWGGGVIYYFSMFLALSILWFLLGGLIGAGIAVYCRRRFPVLVGRRDALWLQCPKFFWAPVILLLAVLLFWGIQGAVYYYPSLIRLWLFNELLGFIPGIFLEFLWGRVLAMLAAAQIKRLEEE